MYEILKNLGYKDAEGSSVEDAMNSKKNGDVSFRNKNFNAAIDSYTKFINVATAASPTTLARRSVLYLMSDSPEEAHNDAIRSWEIFPTWHIASYLEAAAAHFALGKDNEALITLTKGSVFIVSLHRKQSTSRKSIISSRNDFHRSIVATDQQKYIVTTNCEKILYIITVVPQGYIA